MTNTDLKPNPCLHCGSEATHAPRERFRGKVNVNVAWCESKGCPIRGLQMEIAAWNKRYVCLDKNKKPVYAGDEACIMKKGFLGHAFGEVVWDEKQLRWGVKDERGDFTGLSHDDEIELVEVRK